MKVEFINVGGGNMNWTAEIDKLTYDALFRQIRSKGAIMSKSVEFNYNEETKRGQILVGMFRSAGEFQVTES